MLDLYNKIISGTDVKASLLELKKELKTLDSEGTLKDTLLGCSFKEEEKFISLIHDDDPKIRQNCAICMAYLNLPGAAGYIYDAYVTDETLYNKAPYLKALSFVGAEEYKPLLTKRREQLVSNDALGDEAKHVVEEMRELNAILGVKSGHRFTGYELLNEAVLTTNRNHKNITAEKLSGIPHKDFTAGVMVKTKHIADVLKIRTYEEVLFIPDGTGNVYADPHKAAEQVVGQGLVDYIADRHDNPSTAIRFRTEVRHPDTEVRTAFERKFSKDLERLSNWRLVNSVSDYEVELRFVFNPEGSYRLLIGFCLIEDDRFRYRRETLSVGMKPYLAATVCELAKEYYIENSTVLDPFCGTGTLMVERDRVKPVRKLYGIDLYGEAVQKAEVNIKHAGIRSKVELINKDFFEFHHTHRFNEIVTDLPFGSDKRSEADIESIYRNFFRKVPNLLESDNVLTLYVRNREFLLKYSRLSHFTILKEYEISKKENAYLYILTYDNK